MNIIGSYLYLLEYVTWKEPNIVFYFPFVLLASHGSLLFNKYFVETQYGCGWFIEEISIKFVLERTKKKKVRIYKDHISAISVSLLFNYLETHFWIIYCICSNRVCVEKKERKKKKTKTTICWTTVYILDSQILGLCRFSKIQPVFLIMCNLS